MKSAAFEAGPARTTPIVIACWMLWLLPVVAGFAAVKGSFGTLYGAWYWGYWAVVSGLRIAAGIGLWRLRRWGAHLAWITLAGELAFGAYLGEASVFGVLLASITAVLVAVDYRDLKRVRAVTDVGNPL